jgi:hypothetical protein
MAQIDFGFLTRDIARQRELATKALDEAKRIDALLQDANIPNRAELEEMRSKWLQMASELSENVISTSTSANVSISSVIKP